MKGYIFMPTWELVMSLLPLAIKGHPKFLGYHLIGTFSELFNRFQFFSFWSPVKQFCFHFLDEFWPNRSRSMLLTAKMNLLEEPTAWFPGQEHQEQLHWTMDPAWPCYLLSGFDSSVFRQCVWRQKMTRPDWTLSGLIQLRSTVISGYQSRIQ